MTDFSRQEETAPTVANYSQIVSQLITQTVSQLVMQLNDGTHVKAVLMSYDGVSRKINT